MTGDSLPLWKRVALEFVATQPQPGAELTKGYLTEAFGLKTPVTAEDQRVFDLEFMNNMNLLKDYLLKKYKICLEPNHRSVYFVVAPQAQTKHADVKHAKAIHRELRHMMDKQLNVDHSKLTSEQQKENANALARTAHLKVAVRNRNKVQFPKKKQQVSEAVSESEKVEVPVQN